MIVRGIAALLLALFVAGCVTTTDGKMTRKADPEEAAELNLNLGVTYLRQGKLEQAMRKLEKSLQESPNNPAALRVLGLVYERLGDPVRAEQNYRAAVRYGQDEADAYNALGVFLCRRANGDRGQIEEALELFETAVDIPLYRNRFLIYTNAGTCVAPVDPARAEDNLRKALALNPEFPEALYQMSSVAHQQGNHLQARAFLERYIAVSPAVPVVLWLGHRIESALGDERAAEKYSQALIKEYPESVEAREYLEARRDAG